MNGYVWLSRTVVAQVAGLLLLGITVVTDLVGDLQLSGAYVTAVVVASVSASARRTAVVGVAAVAAAAASGLSNDNLGEPAWARPLGGCLAGSLAAVALAGMVRYRRVVQHTAGLAQSVLDALAVELTGARSVTQVADAFLVVDIDPDGEFTLVSCGHPTPLLTSGGSWREVDVEPAPPLGMADQPKVAAGLNDDLALLLAEYASPPTADGARGRPGADAALPLARTG